jgi:hypothetical protein
MAFMRFQDLAEVFVVENSELFLESLERLEHLFQYEVALTAFLVGVLSAFVFLYSFRFR